jgi:small subunit ribosomal protein S20
MANTKQAKKRVRQSEERRVRNRSHRSSMRTAIKKVLTAVSAGSVDEAQSVFRQTQGVIDSMVNKGIIHRNKAARHKSRLSARILALKLSQQASNTSGENHP